MPSNWPFVMEVMDPGPDSGSCSGSPPPSSHLTSGSGPEEGGPSGGAWLRGHSPQAAALTNLLLCHCFHGDGGKVPPPPLRSRAMLYRRWGRGPGGGGAGGGRRERGNGCGGRKEGWGGLLWWNQEGRSTLHMWTHTHTLALVRPCVPAHSAYVFVRLIRGRLKVICKCRTSSVKASAPLVLQLTFICLSFGHTHAGACTHTHNSVYPHFQVFCYT